MEYAIETYQLSKCYGSNAVVSELSLQVPMGSVYGFLGPNGAGKTTTMRMLLGLIRPSAGRVCVLGHDISSHRKVLARHVSPLIEGPGLYPFLSARKNLEVFARTSELRLSSANIDSLISLVGLQGRADDRVQTYSTGMKQRLAIATALLSDPDILVLDEPTNGLDLAGTIEIRDLVRQIHQSGRTILLSSHLMHEIQQMCTHIGIIANGQLLTQGSLQALLTDRQGIRMEVARAHQATALLRQRLQIEARPLEDNWIFVPAPKERMPEILAVLNTAEVGVFQTYVAVDDLEQFFTGLVAQSHQQSPALHA